MSRRRVVVTGLGIVSPVGIGVSEAWGNVIAGKSGITRISRFDTANFTTQIAGEVKNFDVAKWLAPKEARRFDTFIHYGLAAGIDALKDSGIDLEKEAREHIRDHRRSDRRREQRSVGSTECEEATASCRGDRLSDEIQEDDPADPGARYRSNRPGPTNRP